MAEKISPPKIHASAIERLTKSELEIIQEAAEGYTSKEIAIRLGISSKTVEVHRHNIMRKTGARNLLQITITLFRKGVIR